MAATAKIETPESAEDKFQNIVRSRFENYNQAKKSSGFVIGNAPTLAYQKLAEFRLKNFGFEESEQKLQNAITNPDQIAELPTLKIELATLYFAQAKTPPKKSEDIKKDLHEKAFAQIGESIEGDAAYNEIRKDLMREKKKKVESPTVKPEKAQAKAVLHGSELTASNLRGGK